MERYTKEQAEREAESITKRLKLDFPDQEGSFTKEQYDLAHHQETDEIYKTAIGTIKELAIFTDIPKVREAWKLLGGDEEHLEFSGKVSGMPWLVELRYKSSEKLIKEISQESGIKQAVELASGFTPHAANLIEEGVLNNYVESDFLINTEKKKEINKVLEPEASISYAAGNVYEEKTWEKIKSGLNSGPVVIFSEGFMLYTSKDERMRLANLVRDVLEKHGGYFMFEDSTRFHPEFIQHPNFKPFFDKLSKSSQRDLGPITQEDLTKEWEEAGFVIERIPEDVPLASEVKLPELAGDIDLVKKSYKMWKLSLPSL